MIIRLSKKETVITIIVFLYFAIGNLSRMLQLFGVPRELSYSAYLLVLIVFFIKHLNTVRIFDMIYYLFLIPFVTYGLFKYGNYIQSNTDIFAVILVFTPAYLFYRTMQKKEDLLEKGVLAAAWFSAFYLLAYYLIFVRRYTGYSMSYAYWIAFPICVLSDLFCRNRKIYVLALVAVMYISLVLSGCRGALFLTTVYIIWIFGGETLLKRRSIKSILTIIFAIGILVLLAANMNLILSFLARYTGRSRNIRKLLQGEYLDTTSRSAIYNVCKSFINERPLGYGPLASRQLLVGHNYPHSIFYELQLDIGKYPGILVFCILAYMTIANVFYYHNSQLRAIASYLSIVCMGSLMVSSSYYYEMCVPAIVALYVNYLHEAAKKRTSSALT